MKLYAPSHCSECGEPLDWSIGGEAYAHGHPPAAIQYDHVLQFERYSYAVKLRETLRLRKRDHGYA